MHLTTRDVKKVASLAKLAFSESELAHLTQQLGDIVHFVEQLAEVDTDGILEMTHPLDIHSALRADQVNACLPRKDALANSPNSDGEFFLVPPVLGK
ncbi:MAG: Asp-tRNA(Asn)/Glu-tRNA(Gln) amidotransferase subunit GatC [Planctomycetales bacterium]|nr:Asp-tRNA(Asn)/Glu-tRNA(Gln) amidotransferase subunit GatC [Planctomycetales bacterium]